MKLLIGLLLAGLLAGCSTPVEAPDAPIDAAVALIGSTDNRRSMSDYESYGFSGADEEKKFALGPAVKRGGLFFYPVPAGKHKIFVRVLATAHTGLPGLRNSIISLDAVLEGGKAYILTGSREGEVITVWLENQLTRERVSDTKVFTPGRQLLIPIPL